MTTRRQFLKTVPAGVAIHSTPAVLTSCKQVTGKRPSVILMMTDDQGFGEVLVHRGGGISRNTKDSDQ